jgi:hypothetical protein
MGDKKGFLLEKRKETNKPIRKDYALVKHFRKELRAENGRIRGEIALRPGEKAGWRGDWGSFSLHWANGDESQEAAILSSG